MHTTDAPRRTPQRSDARSYRSRILAVARRKLRDDPDASLDSIAQAAGVARRTLYGHFANRRAQLRRFSLLSPQLVSPVLIRWRQWRGWP
jgi:AcrR family transcriptional regulator